MLREDGFLGCWLLQRGLQFGSWKHGSTTAFMESTVAIYSTFYLAAPDELLDGFPGWKLPLDEPEKREITSFFGGKQTIETREPLWDDIAAAEEPASEYGVVAMDGDYADYLEMRLPALVQAAPHWCSKGLTNVELDPLGTLTDGKPVLEPALFAHPSRGAQLLVLRTAIVDAIVQAPQPLAQKWAAHMSTPEYTHSANGSHRLHDDWRVDDALNILQLIGNVAKQAHPGLRLYLLLEW